MEAVVVLELFLRFSSSLLVNRETARTNKTMYVFLSIHRSKPGRYKEIPSASSQEKKAARGRKLEYLFLQKISTSNYSSVQYGGCSLPKPRLIYGVVNFPNVSYFANSFSVWVPGQLCPAGEQVFSATQTFCSTEGFTAESGR